MKTSDTSSIQVGTTVTVGPAYRMGGYFESDEYTGETGEVVERHGFDYLVSLRRGEVWLHRARLNVG